MPRRQLKRRNDNVKNTKFRAEEIKPASRRKGKTPLDYIHTGCSMLNLAGSGDSRGGWPRGRIINIVGDNSTGKTLLALELAAYAHHKLKGRSARGGFPAIKKVEIVYDNAEAVLDFPIEDVYNMTMDDIGSRDSLTIEGFGRYFAKRAEELQRGTCLIYIVDTLDALTSEAEVKQFEEDAKKGKGVKDKGSYNLEKQKYASKFFRNMVKSIEGKDILLVIVSQVRAKIGVSFGKKTYRAGGKALDFYAHQVVWLAQVKKLKRTYQGHERAYGIRVMGKFDKNKVNTPYREAEFPVYFDYGIDDIMSMLDWIYGPNEKKVRWEGMDFDSKEALLNWMLSEPQRIEDLYDEVNERWAKIEKQTRFTRQGKYD